MTARILVVDDDPIQRALLTECLALSGFEVWESDNGADALARSLEQRPDLVLLDVQMPGMGGFEVVRRMRESASLRDVPVLLVSSLDAEHAKVRGLELGADDYITKPYAQAELLARVHAGLRSGARSIGDHSMTGSVEELGLDTLLHTVQHSGRTARIRFYDVAAELLVGRGAILSCSFRRCTGAQALQRLVLVGRGRFAADFVAAPEGDADGAVTVSVALIDALVAADEARRLLSGNPTLVCARGAAAVGPWADAALPTTALDLVAALPGDVREGAELVERAIGDGTLKVIDA